MGFLFTPNFSFGRLFRFKATTPPPAWDPSSLTSLQLWLRGDSFTSSTTATWADKSGNSRNYTATGAARPTVGAGLNSQATVAFDGVNNFLNYAAADSFVDNTEPYSLVVVLKMPDYGSPAKDFKLLMQFYDASAIAPLYVFFANPAGHGGYGAEFSVVFGNGALAMGYGFNNPGSFSSWNSIVGTYVGGAPNSIGSYKYSQDDVGQTVVQSGAFSLQNANQIGTWASAGNADYFFHGEIAEIIITQAVLTSDEETGLASYLSTRYGL